MQQNAGQAQAMPETEAVPAGKRPGARNERLNVRAFVTIAVLTVLELVVYFSIGMIAGSTPIGWCFTLGIQAIPLGIIFMLMYAKVNKRGVVLISGVLVGLLVGMSFWLTGLVIALGALAGEVIWNVANRKRFATMAASFTSIMVGWYLGAFAPLVLMKDFFLNSVPTMAEFYGSVFDIVAGPLFFVCLGVTALGGVLGSLLGRAVLKKHFERAGIA